MISPRQRPLSPDESESLRQSRSGMRAGCISNAAFYGTFLIGMPIVGGGFIGWILRAIGVPKNTAYLISLGIASVVSIAFMSVMVTLDRRIRRETQEDLASGLVEVFTIDVERAWEVDDLDDFGPGFLFETGNGDLVFAASPLFLDFEKKFPCRQITLERLPVTRTVLKASCEGEPIPPEEQTVSINELAPKDLCFGTGCEVLSSAVIPSGVLDKLGVRR